MVVTLLKVYFILITVTGFCVMFADKRKAVRNRWRIPESTIFIIAAAGGSLGVLLGMLLFHHKTRHLSFTLGIPAILAVQIILLILIQ